MKRKNFIRNIFFGVAAAFVPKSLSAHNDKVTYGIDWQPFPLIPSKMQETIISALNPQPDFLKYAPKGKYIDMKYFRNITHSLKPEEAYENMKPFIKMYKKIKNGLD